MGFMEFIFSERFSKILMRVLVILLILMIGVQIGMKAERDRLFADLRQCMEEKNILVKRIEELNKEMKTLRILDELARCESGYRHYVWGDNGKSYGILQFQERTFKYLAKKAGMDGLNWNDSVDQIVLAKWAINNGYGKYWSCFNRR